MTDKSEIEVGEAAASAPRLEPDPEVTYAQCGCAIRDGQLWSCDDHGWPQRTGVDLSDRQATDVLHAAEPLRLAARAPRESEGK